MAAKVAERTLKSDMNKIRNKAGEYVADKIFTKQAKEAKPLRLIVTGELKKIDKKRNLKR